MKTSDVLRRAGDISRERGWCQGWFNNESGAVCAWGGMNLASGAERATQCITPRETMDWFAMVVDSPDWTHSWNDTLGRTHAEVLIALDAAYVLALQEEGIEPEHVL